MPQKLRNIDAEMKCCLYRFLIFNPNISCSPKPLSQLNRFLSGPLIGATNVLAVPRLITCLACVMIHVLLGAEATLPTSVDLKQLDENVLYTIEYLIRTYDEEAGEKAEERERNEESTSGRAP